MLGGLARDRDLCEGRARRPAAGVEQPLAEGGPHVEVHDHDVLHELGGARQHRARRVHDERGTVEDQLVLSPDLVDVDERARGVGRARAEHALALLEPARVVRGGVEVDDELGPARGLRGSRPVRAPDVLADRHAHPYAADDEEHRVALAGGEVALLVEHGVVGQQPLVVHALHLAVGADRGRVVQVVRAVDEAHDRRASAGARRELLERRQVVGDEPRLEQEVLGRVARDRELGEHREIASGRLGAVEHGEQGRHIAVEVAHHGVQLAGGDP